MNESESLASGSYLKPKGMAGPPIMMAAPVHSRQSSRNVVGGSSAGKNKETPALFQYIVIQYPDDKAP